MLKSGLACATFSIAALTAHTALAIPLVYATNEHGGWGIAMGFGSAAEAESHAMEWCGGTANGCKIVMSTDGDCMARVESQSDAGYWYYIGSTIAENGYNRSGEIKRVEDMVMNWCVQGDAPDGTCAVTQSTCADYITNLH